MSDTPIKPRPNWAALRTEYIHGTMTMRELAAMREVSPAALMGQATRKGWEAERKRLQAEVSQKAHEKLLSHHVDQLVEFSAKDVELAIQIKAKVAEWLNTLTNASEAPTLNSLSNSLATAQKVGRLALGAETANNKVTAEVEHSMAPPEDVFGIYNEVKALTAPQ